MLRLVLTRHGQTEWNLQHRYQGWGDSPLTEEGLEQARRLARRLADEPLDAVYASDCERAWRTAEIAVAGRGLRVVQDPAWREIGYGAWEGHTPEEIEARWPGLYARRREDPDSVAPPGGETRLQLQERLLGAVERLRRDHPSQRVLVVTHSGCVGLLGSWFHTGSAASLRQYLSGNCALSAVGWPATPGLDAAAARHAVEFWNQGVHLAGPVDVTARAGPR